MIEMMNGKSVAFPKTSLTLNLQLEVSDPTVIAYLTDFAEDERELKALEALRIGVIALRSVVPTLDVALVDAKFKELERSLDDYARDFTRQLQEGIEHYFRAETGTVPRQLDALIGENGSLCKTLEEYFGVEHGRLAKLVQGQVGPQSEFGRVLDPDNSRGLVQRIQDAVDKKLQESSSAVVQQFSLDADNSALSRLRREVNDQVDQLKRENARFFADLKEHFGVQVGREEEAARGTQKGRDFESALYDRIAEMGRALGDLTENVTTAPGNIPRCKTGDYVSTLGSDSGATGKKIVIEAKNRSGYSLRSAIEELKQAKENRDALVGIMAFSEDCCPPEIGSFRIVEHDILIAVNPESVAANEPNLYLESAYRIARAIVVAERSRQLTSELDVGRVATALGAIESTCEKLAEIHKKAASVKQSAGAIEELADQMRPAIEQRLREIEMLVQQNVLPQAASGFEPAAVQPSHSG